MKKKLISVMLTAMTAAAIPLFTLTGCIGGGELGALTAPVPTQALEQQDLENYISTTGTVEGSNVVHVTTELITKVATLNVELGSKVKAGDVLCTFDTTDLQKQYDSIKGNAERMQALKDRTYQRQQEMLQDAKASQAEMLKKAQKLIDRTLNERDFAQDQIDMAEEQLRLMGEAIDSFASYGDDPVAGETYNNMVEEYNDLGDQIAGMKEAQEEYNSAYEDAVIAYNETERAAQDGVDAAADAIEESELTYEDQFSEELEALQKKIDSAVIKADRSGVITELNIAEGSIPAVPTLMTIEDTNILRINVQISEADILNVHEGQLATIRTTATGETEFTGKVSRVVNIHSSQGEGSMYSFGDQARSYSAEITLDPSDDQLLIGMNAKAKIILEEKKDVMAVPYDAVEENEDGECCVYIAEKDGESYIVRRVEVEKGMEANFFVEVISSELKEGDLIITDITEISEGDTVEITEGYRDDMDAMDADF